eukprot:jgi/Ulvmu1/361/UM001_0367.1
MLQPRPHACHQLENCQSRGVGSPGACVEHPSPIQLFGSSMLGLHTAQLPLHRQVAVGCMHAVCTCLRGWCACAVAAAGAAARARRRPSDGLLAGSSRRSRCLSVPGLAAAGRWQACELFADATTPGHEAGPATAGCRDTVLRPPLPGCMARHDASRGASFRRVRRCQKRCLGSVVWSSRCRDQRGRQLKGTQRAAWRPFPVLHAQAGRWQSRQVGVLWSCCVVYIRIASVVQARLLPRLLQTGRRCAELHDVLRSGEVDSLAARLTAPGRLVH